MQKLQVKSVDDKSYTFNIDVQKGQVLSNNQPFEWDMFKLKEGSYHIIKDNISYNVEVLDFNSEEKNYVMEINGKRYELNLKDRFDLLLSDMGLEKMAKSKIENVKSPMPGKILSIQIEEGQEVEKGDSLMILEAMKMENVIKSPTAGIIKKINVNEGESVEKNYVLIDFK